VEEFTSAREGARVRYSHVNCYIHRTFFSIMQRVASDLGISVPRRGFSREELFRLVWNSLESRDEYLIVTIDEAHFLTNPAGSEALYKLSRIPEYTEGKHRMGFIYVFRDISAIYMLDKSIQSTLQHNIIRFEPYTSAQIEDILWARVNEEGALYPSAVSEEVIAMIGELVGKDRGGSGDARLALELLYRAGKYAEGEDRDQILPEDVRRAYSSVVPHFSLEMLKELRLMEKLVLLALTRLLKRKKFVSKVPIGVLEREYEAVCEEFGVKPRRHTMVWEYVRNLSTMGIVTTEKSGKGYRGRTTLVGISGVPLAELERELVEGIRREAG